MEQQKQKWIASKTDAKFLKLKKRKLIASLSFHIHCVIHSFFIIYLLGIWGIADVFHYFRMQNWENTNMNLFLSPNSGYDSFLSNLNAINSKYANLGQDESATGSTSGRSLIAALENFAKNQKSFNYSTSDNDNDNDENQKSVSLLSKYYNKYRNEFYQHSFYHQLNVEFKKSTFRDEDGGAVNSKQLKSIAKIRGLFVVKVHTQVLGDLVIMAFLCLVIFNLDVIESLLGKFALDREVHQYQNHVY